MRAKRSDILELQKDINKIIADIYGVSFCISRHSDTIAKELVKLGYKKEKQNG